MVRNMRLTANERMLLADIIADCVDCGITVNLVSDDKLEDSTGVFFSGLFSEENMSLDAATLTDNWMFTFTHEYSHFRQLREGFYKDAKYAKAYNLMADIEGGTRGPSKAALQAARLVQEVEADAEKRAFELLNGYNVVFDQSFYIKQSNAYLYLYTFYAIYGGIQPGHAPSKILEIIDIMPDTFPEHYLLIPQRYVELVTEKCGLRKKKKKIRKTK